MICVRREGVVEKGTELGGGLGAARWGKWTCRRRAAGL
jgi:hypothetical protein